MAGTLTRQQLIDMARGKKEYPLQVTEHDADGSPHYYIMFADNMRFDCGNSEAHMRETLEMFEGIKEIAAR